MNVRIVVWRQNSDPYAEQCAEQGEWRANRWSKHNVTAAHV